MVADSNVQRPIPVDSIAILLRHRESHFREGAAWGVLGGVILGAVIGVVSTREPKSSDRTYDESKNHGGDLSLNMGFHFGKAEAAVGYGLLGALGGFFVGGIVGSNVSGDEVHDLRNMNRALKVQVIRQFLSLP
jgi:hypothetical protein